MAAALLDHGHGVVDGDGAEVFIVNSCSVRDAAERKVLERLRRLVAGRTGGRFPIVGVAGCMAQRLGADLFDSVPGLNFVIGTKNFHRVAEVLERVEGGEGQILLTEDCGCIFPPPARDWSQHRPSAFVNISTGCPMGCTYCIVPSTRGKECSRTPEDILGEVRRLAETGTREVVLLGQIVNLYGVRRFPFVGGESPFVGLLRSIHAIDGIDRIRFLSPHPCGFHEDLIGCFSSLPKLVQAVHLPIQSGSDRILRSMGRGYGREKVLGILHRLRKEHPLLSLSTDLIVGFPGETDEDFAATEQLFDEIDFDMAYIFKFSPRAGTPAAGFPGQIPEEISAERNRHLLGRLSETSLRRNRLFLHTTQDVLAEAVSRKDADVLVGHDHHGKKVFFRAPPDKIGEILPVTVTDASVSALIGRAI
jgi:tRNA-2-methylthio-N6-dimethylallyladenosine synthase